MVEVAPIAPDPWHELSLLLNSGERATYSSHGPTDSHDEASHAETESVMHSEALKASYDELLRLVLYMGFEVRFVDGLKNIENIHHAMLADWNQGMANDITGVNLNKALLCFDDGMKHDALFLFPIAAKVLAKIAFILAHVYEKWEHALGFCDRAHMCFQHTFTLCTKLTVQQASNCMIAAETCRKTGQTSLAREWARRAVVLLSRCMLSISNDTEDLCTVGNIYNHCAWCYYDSGGKRWAGHYFQQAYNVYKMIDYVDGMRIVSLNMMEFSI